MKLKKWQAWDYLRLAGMAGQAPLLRPGPSIRYDHRRNDAVRSAPDLPGWQGEKRRHSGALSRLFDAVSPAKTSGDGCTN